MTIDVDDTKRLAWLEASLSYKITRFGNFVLPKHWRIFSKTSKVQKRSLALVIDIFVSKLLLSRSFLDRLSRFNRYEISLQPESPELLPNDGGTP
jgi:hypothetical protein